MTDTQTKSTLTAQQISELVGASILGDGSRCVASVNVIEHAEPGQLAFVGNRKQIKRCGHSAANVIIAPPQIEDVACDYPDVTFIVTDDPETAFLQIAQELNPPRERSTIGISPLAVVSPTAKIGSRTNIHPHAVIGDDVVIGDACDIGPGVVIGDGCVLGDNVILDANVVLYREITLGSDVSIHAGSVLGADGFGYKTVDGRHERLPHVGSLQVQDDVEIGACVTIDRGKAGDTVIGHGTRMDNMVVIAHNCQIGEHNLLASQTGIAGSSSTGQYVVCAGQVGIADHVHLGDFAIFGAQSGVRRDMPGGTTYLGAPAEEAVTTAKVLSTMKRLPEIRTTVKLMEKQIAELQSQIQQLLASPEAESQCEAA